MSLEVFSRSVVDKTIAQFTTGDLLCATGTYELSYA